MYFEKHNEYIEKISQLKNHLEHYGLTLNEFLECQEIQYFERIWAINVRKSLDIGAASDETVMFLREQDIDWGVPMLLWREWCLRLKKYVEESHILCISKDIVLDDGLKIGVWTTRQIREFAKLSTEQQNNLLDSGLDLGKLEKLRQVRLEKEKELDIQFNSIVNQYDLNFNHSDEKCLFENCVRTILGSPKVKNDSYRWKNKYVKLICDSYINSERVSNYIWMYIADPNNEHDQMLSEEQKIVGLLLEIMGTLGEDKAFQLFCLNDSRIKFLFQSNTDETNELSRKIVHWAICENRNEIVRKIFTIVEKFSYTDIENLFVNLSKDSRYQELLFFLLEQKYSFENYLKIDIYLQNINCETQVDEIEFDKMITMSLKNQYDNLTIELIDKTRNRIRKEVLLKYLESFLSTKAEIRYERFAMYFSGGNSGEWLTDYLCSSENLIDNFLQNCNNESIAMSTIRKLLMIQKFQEAEKFFDRIICSVYDSPSNDAMALRIIWNNRDLLTDNQSIRLLEIFIMNDDKACVSSLQNFFFYSADIKWFAKMITMSSKLEAAFLEQCLYTDLVACVIYEYLQLRKYDMIEQIFLRNLMYSFSIEEVTKLCEVLVSGLEENLISVSECNRILVKTKEEVRNDWIREALEKNRYMLLFGVAREDESLKSNKDCDKSKMLRPRANCALEPLDEGEMNDMSIQEEYYLSFVLDTLIFRKMQKAELISLDTCQLIHTEQEAFRIFKDILVGKYNHNVNNSIINLVTIFNRYWGFRSRASEEIFLTRRQCILDYWVLNGSSIPVSKLIEMLDGKENIKLLGKNKWIFTNYGKILSSRLYEDYENFVVNSKSFFDLQEEIYNFEKYHELIFMASLLSIKKRSYRAFTEIIVGPTDYNEIRSYPLYKGMNFNQNELTDICNSYSLKNMAGVCKNLQVDENGEVIIYFADGMSDAKALAKIISKIISREIVAWAEMKGDTKSLYHEFSDIQELNYLSKEVKQLLYLAVMNAVSDIIPFVKIGHSKAIIDYKCSLSTNELLCKVIHVKRVVQDLQNMYEERTEEFTAMAIFCREFFDVLLKEEQTIKECLGEEITTESIQDAKRVLALNQERLIVEDEVEELVLDKKEVIPSLSVMEKQILAILLSGKDKHEGIKKLELNHVAISFYINRINEYAMEKIGDIVICTADEPSIYEEYIEECEKWCYE